MPISRTIRDIKKVWIYIICLLIRLTCAKSLSHLKYLGKTICKRESMIRSVPASRRLNSMLIKDKSSDKWSGFLFFDNFKPCLFKCSVPGLTGDKMEIPD